MAFGPYWNQLAEDVSTGKRFVNPDNWNAVIDNFVNWKGNVNGGGFNLSNVGVLTASSITGSGITAVQGTDPSYSWYETDGPSDAKRWSAHANGGSFYISIANDGQTVGQNCLQIDRSGVTPTLASFSCNVRAVSTAPSFEWAESGGPVDEKYSRIVSDGGMLYFSFINDARTASADWLVVDRNAITPTEASLSALLNVLRGNVPNTAGANLTHQRWFGNEPAGNTDSMVLRQERGTAGTAWDGVNWFQGRWVDGVAMAQIGWVGQDIVIYTGGSERVRISQDGSIRMVLGTTPGASGSNKLYRSSSSTGAAVLIS